MMDRKKKTLLSPLLDRTLEALKGQRSVQTLENYHSSINKVKEFVGDGWERLTVEDITRCWTDRFTTWLESRHGDKPQTVDFYLRTFRALYGHALALSDNKTDGKPFGGHHTGGSFPAKRALHKEEVQRLLSPALRQTLPENRREALDVLLFILYARGMVFKDVYNLTRRMVTDRHIRYLRSKTGVPIDVEVVPELEEIMKRYYREDSPFVFPFLHEVRKGCPGKELSEESALRRINRSTREIGRKTGLSVPLTTYVLRHTWATLMLEDCQPVELISQCMGHSSIRTTQIYLSRISSRKVDTAVNGMYDRMLRQPGHKRKERGIPSERSGKFQSVPPQPLENRNTQPHISQTPENKKCPFLNEKDILFVSHEHRNKFRCKSIYFTGLLQIFFRFFLCFTRHFFLPSFPLFSPYDVKRIFNSLYHRIIQINFP